MSHVYGQERLEKMSPNDLYRLYREYTIAK